MRSSMSLVRCRCSLGNILACCIVWRTGFRVQGFCVQDLLSRCQARGLYILSHCGFGLIREHRTSPNALLYICLAQWSGTNIIPCTALYHT